jgi:hypothetical protein
MESSLSLHVEKNFSRDGRSPPPSRPPGARSRLTNFGYEIFPREKQTPEMLGALVKADAERWWPIIK